MIEGRTLNSAAPDNSRGQKHLLFIRARLLFDATGVLRTDWPPSSAAQRCTFTTGRLTLFVNDKIAINHLRLTRIN